MSVSMRVMSAGDGYKYLLRTVAAADGERPLSTPLTRYYAEAGTPPGRWLGSGLPALADGRIAAGSRVSEAQLELLLGMGRDPGTGAPLGRAYPEYAASEPSSGSPIAQPGDPGSTNAGYPPPRCGRLRLHLLAAEVGVRPLGDRRRRHPSEDRRRTSHGGRRRARLHGARTCRHARWRSGARRCRCTGRGHGADRRSLRSLRLARGRSAVAHARRGEQQGAHGVRRQVALARWATAACGDRRAVRVAQRRVRRPPDACTRPRVGAARSRSGSQPRLGDHAVCQSISSPSSRRARVTSTSRRTGSSTST